VRSGLTLILSDNSYTRPSAGASLVVVLVPVQVACRCWPLALAVCVEVGSCPDLSRVERPHLWLFCNFMLTFGVFVLAPNAFLRVLACNDSVQPPASPGGGHLPHEQVFVDATGGSGMEVEVGMSGMVKWS
jgi:hypothetical protein